MANDATPAAPPVSIQELTKIATEACDATLGSAKSYDHTQVGQWNSQIISSVLKALITATAPKTDAAATQPAPPYRFNVNSTIVQQDHTPSENSDNASTVSAGAAGKRGMHSASGAFWDVKKDGMWTFKYQGAEGKGMDIVLSVIWFGVF